MSSEKLFVVRGEFSMNDPWAVPGGCEPVRLCRATDGAMPRLATTVYAYFDDDYFSVVFAAADDRVEASFLNHDDPLYEQDVVEVFVAPERRSEYFEIEVSPIGTTLDARIVSPDGVRKTMQSDFGWTCEGLVTAVRRRSENGGLLTIDSLIRIPFRAIGGSPEKPWSGNFFRIDRHPVKGDEFSAWRPTRRDPADFHVTAAFGELLFEG